MANQTIEFNALDSSQKQFLGQFSMDATSGIPIYLRNGGEAILITGGLCPVAKQKLFEETTVGTEFFRGGATILVETHLGIIVAPDERHLWFRPIPGGVANGFTEGIDPIINALREFEEELFITDQERKVRLCPAGVINPDLFSRYLKVQTSRVRTVGELALVSQYFNEDNRAYESVFQWDISEEENYLAVCQEEWALGNEGEAGINLLTLDLEEKKVTGLFSGRQGLIPIPDYGLHPAFAKYTQVLK